VFLKVGQRIMMECVQCELDLNKNRDGIENYSRSGVEVLLQTQKPSMFYYCGLLFMFEALGKYFWFEKYINIYSQTIQYKQLWQSSSTQSYSFSLLQSFSDIHASIYLFL